MNQPPLSRLERSQVRMGFKFFSLFPALALATACTSSSGPGNGSENTPNPTGPSSGGTTGTATGTGASTGTGANTGTSAGGTGPGAGGTGSGGTGSGGSGSGGSGSGGTGSGGMGSGGMGSGGMGSGGMGSGGTGSGGTGGMPAVCSNGVAEAGEDCDGSDLRGTDCKALGFDSGSLACSGECKFDSSACENGGTLVTRVTTFCDDTCSSANNGTCQDGGPMASVFPRNLCDFGTDCSDCGSQQVEIPVVSGGGQSACGQPSYGAAEDNPAENWTTYNQFGAAVSLSDFCGKWVYIELGRMDCGVCIGHLDNLQEMTDELGNYEDGFVAIATLGNNLNPIAPNYTNIATVPEIQAWLDRYTNDPVWFEFGVWDDKVQVVADARREIWNRYFSEVPTGRTPQAMLINPNGEIDVLGQQRLSWIKSKMERWP